MASWPITAGETLADRLVSPRLAWRDILLVGAGAALMAALAQVAIRLPWTPVPLTGQTFGVLVTGAALGWRRGVLAMLLYILVGVLGLPVFAGGSGGLAILLGANGGYLIGFLAAAGVVGWLAQRGWDRGGRVVFAMLAGEALIYLMGVAGLAVYLGSVDRAIILGFLPFILGDAIKLGLACGLLPVAWRVVGKLDAR